MLSRLCRVQASGSLADPHPYYFTWPGKKFRPISSPWFRDSGGKGSLDTRKQEPKRLEDTGELPSAGDEDGPRGTRLGLASQVS